MNEAPRRDVEVLPPEDPADVFHPNRTRMKNITPVEQQQEISELLERQVKRPATPPPATPPATGNYKTIPVTDPLATPPNFTPRQPVSGPNPAPGAKPSGLPFPAGKLAAPLVGGAIDFGFRVVAGQPVGQAAAGAIGSTVGSVVGGALGSAVGPVGTFVGGVIGGFVGGAIADAIFKVAFPSTGSLENDPYLAPPPFLGGQEPVLYYWNYSTLLNPRSAALGNLVFTATGPISDYRIERSINIDTVNGIKCEEWEASFQAANGIRISGKAVGFFPDDLPRLVIARADSLPDFKNPPAPAPPPDPRPYDYWHSEESNFSVKRGNLAPKIPPTNYAPGPTTPKGNPRGDAPNWVPSGFPVPKKNPNPNTTPSNLGGDFPGTSPNPALHQVPVERQAPALHQVPVERQAPALH
ncbi:MAG: glycine zipper domain-containing protein [Nostoc sp.]|uniref:glycine zipper domain-containing protein n=1 Tax=Nostoc sp. TaxID=1180 RepID=UPI002FF6D518